MESWLGTTLTLGLYGLLKEFRPSEPFLTEYLMDEEGANITLGQVNLISKCYYKFIQSVLVRFV